MSERTFYMPAVSAEEARSLVVAGYGHLNQEDADKHLTEIKASADPFYGNQYKVHRVVVHPRVDSIKVTRRRRG